MNHKNQTFFLLVLLTCSGNMIAGKKTKKEYRRFQIMQQREDERNRAASAVEDEEELCDFNEGQFGNPNHRGIEPTTSNTKLPRRARKLQAKADMQAEKIAARFSCKGRRS